MAKKNNDYWKSRFAAMENSQYVKSSAYIKDVENQFRMAQKDILLDIEKWYRRLADNNGVSLQAAKRLLSKKELEEFKWSVQDYIKKGKENAFDQRWMKELENASARAHITRLEAMKLEIQQHTELLYRQYHGGVTELLGKCFTDKYQKTAFEIAKGTGVGSNLAKIDTRRIDTVLKSPWAQDGANFSDRIWKDKNKLLSNLHTELTQNIIRGSPPKQAINNLAKTMNVSKKQAGRLIMTESAAIASRATQESYKDLGIETYEILATLDSKTSTICQEMDGKVIGIKEYEVGVTAPPFHPWCRTTTMPYYNDEFTAGEERAARGEDGNTYSVPTNIKYQEWKEKYVKGAVTTVGKDDILEEKLREQLKGLTQEEIKALRGYTGFDAQKINSALATGKNLDNVLDKIALLDSALSKGVIPEDIMVIRKTIPEYLNVFPQGAKITDLDIKQLVGQNIGNDIFTSTSLSEFPYPKRNVVIKISIPKGYEGGLYIKDIAVPKYKEQEEILLKRGFQYQVTKVHIENGIYYLEAEVIK